MFPEFDDPMWPLLAQVARPSRYSGSERRPVQPDFHGPDRLKICLAFPDVYEIGMSYYGFQLLVPFLLAMKDISVDRAYCPWVDMEALLRKRGLPLASVEFSLPLSQFDVVGFTLQHELCYTNVLTMLDLGGIPLHSSERGEHDPLVIAGGPGALIPAPLAPFVDVFCVGEGEAILPALLSVLRETQGAGRDTRLEACAKIPGVYVPAFPRRVLRQFCRSFEQEYLSADMIVPSVSIVHDRAAMELFRGCSRGCRFCQAGSTTRPVRERRPETVINTILNLVKKTGWEEVGLLSLASCDYSGIGEVIDRLTGPLTEMGVHLSLPSLRMDGFSLALAERLQKVRRGGLTFAPEAGTQRLRDVINKGIDEESIFNCVDQAFSMGWDHIKLYFMMGLPTETEKDLDGIVALSKAVIDTARRHKRRRATVAVSVAGFVPKAHTPFQWERQNTIEEFQNKGRYMKFQIKDKALSLKYHEPEQSFLEGVLARGDLRTAAVIESAWRDGARFDSWTETFNLQRWLSAFEKCGLDPSEFTRERAEDETLPWDIVDVGVSKDFLRRERAKAQQEQLTPDCRHLCSGCGIGCQNVPRSEEEPKCL